jgi:hypothetical protein
MTTHKDGEIYLAMVSADNAYHAALVDEYGDCAGDKRYEYHPKGSRLERLATAYKLLSSVWFNAQDPR